MVNELVPFPLIVFVGAKTHEASVGRPLQVRVTIPLKPFRSATVRISGDVVLPFVTISVVGLKVKLIKLVIVIV